jgi:hypothetical protein
MRTRTLVVSAIFYVAVAALLLGVLFQEWAEVLPKSLATRIGHNTEGYVLALAIGGWIQFARPKIKGSRAEWIVTALVSLAFVGLTVYLLTGGLASRFKTLNEGTLAAALLIPYYQLRRPLPRWVAPWMAIVIVLVTIVTIRSSETTDLAETYGMLLLGIVGFDLVDKGILDPAAVTSTIRRYAWYAILIIAPIVFSVSEYHLDAGSTGILGEPVRFLVRITEAFIFALFVEVFFAIGLRCTGSQKAHASTEETVARPAARVQ